MDQEQHRAGVCASARGQAVKWNQLLSPGRQEVGRFPASPVWFCGAFTLACSIIRKV